MKKASIFILLLYLDLVSVAQKRDTITLAQMRSASMTVEQLLGLPSSYTVLYCSIYGDDRQGAITVDYYAKAGSKYAVKGAITDFGQYWVKYIKSGDKKITIEE